MHTLKSREKYVLYAESLSISPNEQQQKKKTEPPLESLIYIFCISKSDTFK